MIKYLYALCMQKIVNKLQNFNTLFCHVYGRQSNCQAQVQSQIQVPNPSPKFRSQIQVPNPKSKVQRKGTATGADNIILQDTTLPPTPNFSHLNCQSSDGKSPSMTFLDLP